MATTSSQDILANGDVPAEGLLQSTEYIRELLSMSALTTCAAPRPQGILALMPCSVSQYYPHDGAEWTTTEAATRRRRYYSASYKRTLLSKQTADDQEHGITLPKFLSMESGDAFPIVIVLILDPIQKHSVRLLEKVVDICGGDERLRCLVVSQRLDVNLDGLLQHSGIGVLPFDETFGVWAITACGVSACPGIVVLDSKVGRKINSRAEVIAVENNSSAHVRSQWMLHQSAATGAQSIQEALCVIS